MEIPSKWCVVVLLLCAAGCAATPAHPAHHPAHSPARSAAREGLQRFEYSQLLMGVQVRLVLYTKDETAAKAAAKAAFARVAELEDVMSDYRSGSEVMRLCARSGSGPVQVSADLFRVLAHAQRVAEASGGAFDVTVGPLVQLWRRSRK